MRGFSVYWGFAPKVWCYSVLQHNVGGLQCPKANRRREKGRSQPYAQADFLLA